VIEIVLFIKLFYISEKNDYFLMLLMLFVNSMTILMNFFARFRLLRSIFNNYTSFQKVGDDHDQKYIHNVR
jgi:hypothetical protein